MPQSTRNRLAVAVYDQIKEQILLNEYKPGDRLSENQIAKDFGVSRTPVREAMKMLANERLVEIHNGAGIFIRMVTLKEITDIFQVREILECNAMLLSWGRITPGEIEEMRLQWDELGSRIDSGQRIDAKELTELDMQFHQTFSAHCSNQYLSFLLSEIKDKIKRFQFMAAASLDNARETVNQHLAILGLVKEDKKEETLAALKSHIQDAMGYIVDKKQYTL